MNIMEKTMPSALQYNESNSYKGYTLFTPLGSKNIYLIDMKGKVVHSWNLPFQAGNHGELLPNGNLLYAAKVPRAPLADFDGTTGILLEMDWSGSVVWQYEDSYMHHDFCRLPNGNTLLLRWVSTPEEIAHKVQGGLPNTEREGIIWSDSLQEINPAGEKVWEWLSYEHLDPEIDTICPLCYRNNWPHINSFTVTTDGDILISCMKTNRIAVVSKDTGEIKWRWGGFLKLGHPHDVCWSDSENIIILSSGGHLAGFEQCNSEVLWINMGTDDMVCEYREPYGLQFFAPCQGGLQRLPNGNVLVTEGDTGRIFELTDNQDIVWEFVNPFYHPSPIYGRNNMVFRAYRYGFDYRGLKGNEAMSDKFQALSKEIDKPQGKKTYTPKGEKALQDRLTSLGY